MKTTNYYLTVTAGILCGLFASPGSGRAQDVVEIAIRSSAADAFFPQTAEVRIGQQVRWTNIRGGAAHSVTRETEPQIDLIPIIRGDQSITVTITQEMFGSATTLPYFCQFHPMMKGTLTLAGGGPGPGPTPTPTPGPTPPPQANVTINITGSGSTAKLIAEGQTEQQPVAVAVGQTVRWVNQTPQQHVLDASRGGAEPIFHAVVPGNGGTWQKLFTTDDFQRAGGQGTQTVALNYRSQTYSEVASSLNLTGTEPVPPDPPTTSGPPAAIGTPYGVIAVFEDAVVDDSVTNSYYILSSDINNDGKPDLVTSGLGAPEILMNPSTPADQKQAARGKISWYENPSWRRRDMATLDVPVPIAAADIDGDGNTDIATSWNYGLCIFNCADDSGTTSWLKNPGVSTTRPWERFHIGNLMANHRLFFGHYTQLDRLELLALPVVGGTRGRIHAPLTSTVYVQPDDPVNTQSWPSIAANKDYTLVHDASIHKYRASDGSLLDSALIASGEGISWLYYDKDKTWKSIRIGQGEQSQGNANNFKGSGGVAPCHYGNDPFSYLVTHEPLHGNILALYTKNSDGRLEGMQWKRTVLDTFGPLNDNGEGPMHQVIAVDVDGDHVDEFLVALRGPLPHQGVFIYKAVDPASGSFVRQRLSSISAARIAVDDFDGDGLPDFTTTPYDVSTYYDAKEPHIMMFYNRTPQKGTAHTASK